MFKLIPAFIQMEVDFKNKYEVKFGALGEVVAQVDKKDTD